MVVVALQTNKMSFTFGAYGEMYHREEQAVCVVLCTKDCSL